MEVEEALINQRVVEEEAFISHREVKEALVSHNWSNSVTNKRLSPSFQSRTLNRVRRRRLKRAC